MENGKSEKQNDIKRGLRDGIPIALGYLSVSFAFGIMAVSEGLTAWQAILISVANVTSAGQFAGVEIMTVCGGLVEMALTQLVINIRYALMSLSLAQKVDSTFKKPTRMAVSFCVTDEIFAVSVSRNKTISKYYMLGIISVSYVGWIAGTAFGAVLGGVLPAVISDALGIAIYGMFLAIILPAARDDSRYLKLFFESFFFLLLIIHNIKIKLFFLILIIFLSEWFLILNTFVQIINFLWIIPKQWI